MEIRDIAPFAALAIALLALLFSTRQMPLLARLVAWLTGVGALIAAGSLLLGQSHYGLFAMLMDGVRSPFDSALTDALRDWSTVAANLLPMFDILAALAGVLALAALVALSPGDHAEKVIRPLMIGLIGAALGGFLALALVASGLGGYQKRAVYIAIVEPNDVVDGDTIRMGDVSLRLSGIDAPEFHSGPESIQYTAHNQACLDSANQRSSCGLAARAHLVDLVKGRIVECGAPLERSSKGELREAFGRPIVRCLVRQNGAPPIDLSEQMAHDGYADAFQDRDGFHSCYTEAVLAAQKSRSGLWSGTWLAPYKWRNDDAARRAFLEDGVVPPTLAPQPGLRC